MKRMHMLIVGMAVALVSLALPGCQKQEADKEGSPATTQKAAEPAKAAEHPAAGKTAEAAKPAGDPADQKPKDHPAH